MNRRGNTSLPIYGSPDGLVTNRPRRRWPDPEAARRGREAAAAERAAHIAEHGEHECTPDPLDPWSTCHREKETTP